MVRAHQYRMRLVWVMIYNSAQLFSACRPSVASADISVHRHSEPGMVVTLSQAPVTGRFRSINRNLAFQVQQPDSIMHLGSQGGMNWKSRNNFLCRTLGRCLLQELTSSPPHDSPDVVSAVESDNNTDGDPPMTLPNLPTDPESPPPPAPARTNPSTLLTPNFHPSGPGNGGSPSTALTKGSNMAGKVGISAGVGVSGILLLIVALLYYFKPDIFMCCKTCVRVQVFHHNHPTKK